MPCLPTCNKQIKSCWLANYVLQQLSVCFTNDENYIAMWIVGCINWSFALKNDQLLQLDLTTHAR